MKSMGLKIISSMVLTSGALLAGLLGSWHPRSTVERRPWPMVLEPLGALSIEMPTPTPEYPRYRYSVVAGGIHDLRALAKVTGRDPVVRAHYADIQLPQLRFTRLERDRKAFVSYRVGDTIFWTRHRILLSRGEEILTDGNNYLRGRCGNRISDTPREPVETGMPKRNLDQFEPSLESMLPLPPAPGGTLSPGDPLPAIEVSAVIAPVPEPATVVLCLSGIVALFLKSTLTQRRVRRPGDHRDTATKG